MCARLEIVWSGSLRTTALTDALCTRTDGGRSLYSELLLKDCFSIGSEHKFSVSLLMSRFDWRESFINDFMTFSRFRKLTGRCYNENGCYPAIIQQVLLLDRREGSHELKDVVLLHAQNSSQRKATGGARYGQTDTYMFTNAVFERIDDKCIKSEIM